jgi:hypothetical protein
VGAPIGNRNFASAALDKRNIATVVGFRSKASAVGDNVRIHVLGNDKIKP